MIFIVDLANKVEHIQIMIILKKTKDLNILIL